MKVSKDYCFYIHKNLPVVSYQRILGESVLLILAENLILTLRFLKNHISCQYKVLSCVSGVDFVGKASRFAVCYDLLSVSFNARVRVKALLNETTSISSCSEVYPNSIWWEREIWDLYGIFFENHSDLRRILTDYGFEGSPMRKDFPLSGYVELRYDEHQKRLLVEPVELSQEFRFFEFEMPW